MHSPKELSSSLIRKRFLDYFAHHSHKVVGSDSLIPSSDPSLLFTSAGMVQFKKYFAEAPGEFSRAANCQKCFRTSDIDEIGRTSRHLSFFEMLGNFSFGDYFKDETIELAWDFLINEMHLDKSKLYVTVYKDDTEAYQIWKKFVSEDRIYKLDEKTNFWNMGPTGPCGPCSEIIQDLGKEVGCGRPDCNVTCDCDRWLEVWNLVFTQFDRQEDGKLLPLPQKNIDTGMGLERLAAVVNNRKTVFETDLFMPIIKQLEETLQRDYGSDSKTDVVFRIISDHVRAATFLISDGIFPSNEGRGYVLRRIIRRAIRQGKLLNMTKPFMYKLTGKVVGIMKDAYPDLVSHRENIAMMVKMEEEKFLETLDTGINLLNDIIRRKAKRIPGKDVFHLYDTYGFPPELTKEILAEHNLDYDEEEYIKSQNTAQQIARKSWKGITMSDAAVYRKYAPVKFSGYEKLETTTIIRGIIKNARETDNLKENEEGEVILEDTPFYPESGGQVGDKGEIKLEESNFGVVSDTQKPLEDVIAHRVKLKRGELNVGQTVTAAVHTELRKSTMRHHTATHLLHRALREIIGSHATQSGSLVAPERFRFDYVGFKALSDDQKERIEQFVNERIMRCLPVNTVETTNEQAKEWGAMALFGEKYGERVRCIIIGGEIVSEPSGKFHLVKPAESIELCGGTHCRNTGEIGVFKILSESSVGSNLRRIEAICGRSVHEHMKQNETIIDKISSKLKTKPDELPAKIDKLLQLQKKLENEIRTLEEKLLTGDESKKMKVHEIKKMKLIIQKVENTPVVTLRDLADRLNAKFNEKSIILLLNATEDKINFVVSVTKDIAGTKKADADIIAKKVAKLFKGSGGGRKDFAQGGGKKVKSVSEKNIVSAIKSICDL